ncbi:hypothetical protein SEUCBS139899_010055 [Sporothrix eucalyptigena]|uniref:Uncharacterized protein n=1 Tax=Sporothrix eucalyptigena TaxID=1812306 RepID=A0ABP0BC98_9PEZI
MLDRLWIWLGYAPPLDIYPPPKLQTIQAIRFPANNSPPHLVQLTTTTDSVKDSGVDGFWGHVPDLRVYWKTERAWIWRDIDTFRFDNGLYIVYFSFDLEALPSNTNFPVGPFGRERAFAGDAFVVRIQGTQIGEDLGEDGWAVWEDVPSDILELPIMNM